MEVYANNTQPNGENIYQLPPGPHYRHGAFDIVFRTRANTSTSPSSNRHQSRFTPVYLSPLLKKKNARIFFFSFHMRHFFFLFISYLYSITFLHAPAEAQRDTSPTHRTSLPTPITLPSMIQTPSFTTVRDRERERERENE